MSRPLGTPAGGARTFGFILIASLTLVFIATAGSVWWYYTRQLSAMEEAVILEMTAVSDSKTRQIANWRNERLGDGHVQMASPAIHIAERILAGHASQSDRDGWLEVITRLQTAFLYSGAVLSDLDGKVHIATPGVSTDASRLRSLSRAAVQAKDVQLSDLDLDPQTGHPLMALTIPVGDAGAIVLDIDPWRFLYPYLDVWPGRRQTAENILWRREGDDALFLSEMRFSPAPPLGFRRSLTELGVGTDAALGASPLARVKDYRGVPALRLIRHIPNSPWYLMTRIDAAEADAPERRLGWEMAVVTALITLIIATGAGLLWQSQRTRILEEREAWFNTIANETPAFLWMSSANLENVFINTSLAKFLGTDRNQLLNEWADQLHPDDAAAVHSALLESARTQSGFTQEFRIRRFDGEYRWAVSTALPRFSPKGTFLGLAGSLLDTTERRQAEQKLREAYAAIAADLAESIRKEQEIQDLSARLINAHEEERSRLARELHDDLSQQIAALSISTGNLKRHVPEEYVEARALSDRIHGKLVRLAGDVRRMSHELHPAILEHSGLATALRAYSEEFSTLNGIQVVMHIHGSFEGIAPATALCLYRVTQESMRNVARHAGVSTASVELKRANGVLRLAVSDKGAGMEPGRAAARAGLGLLNIHERARLVGGKVEIWTKPGEGTTVILEVPE